MVTDIIMQLHKQTDAVQRNTYVQSTLFAVIYCLAACLFSSGLSNIVSGTGSLLSAGFESVLNEAILPFVWRDLNEHDNCQCQGSQPADRHVATVPYLQATKTEISDQFITTVYK